MFLFFIPFLLSIIIDTAKIGMFFNFLDFRNEKLCYFVQQNFS